MARLGKTLKEEIKAGRFEGNLGYSSRQPIESYGSSPTGRIRTLVAYFVLGLSLVLFLMAYWLAGLVLLFLFVVMMFVRAPRGPFYQDDDNG